jgi:hypoxanthine phosphoribosyltransferase
MDSAPRFNHEAEREVAHLLSFYGLEWRYEPDTFPLRFDRDGKPTEAFSPDFYVPALDLYIEVTAAKNKYCRLKHRKIRLFRELYPDRHIKLLDRHDIEALLLRSGQGRRISAVSGAAGEHIVAERPPRVSPRRRQTH